MTVVTWLIRTSFFATVVIAAGSSAALDQRCLNVCRVQAKLQIFLVSRAAHGICKREGVHTIRHSAARPLWLQEIVPTGNCRRHESADRKQPRRHRDQSRDKRQTGATKNTQPYHQHQIRDPGQSTVWTLAHVIVKRSSMLP